MESDSTSPDPARVPCSECGAMKRPKSPVMPDLCVRCAGDDRMPEPGSGHRPFVYLIGVYDSVPGRASQEAR